MKLKRLGKGGKLFMLVASCSGNELKNDSKKCVKIDIVEKAKKMPL
ncbi:hypothetical protein DAC17_111 [Bacteroides phage DAC17]|nr:hypothetical protein DAC17_111 [Bacteroides phage DAC17]